jgi:hypothetical protein
MFFNVLMAEEASSQSCEKVDDFTLLPGDFLHAQ